MPSPVLPPGERLRLPGRGTTFVRTVRGPSPAAPTLFLLHGWMANADLNWFTAYGGLGRDYNLVAIDHRGHGRGIRSRGIFRLEDCADDVAAAADVLGIDRFIPVGYSMGGAVAQLVWRRHGSRVDGLVLCATARNFGRRASDRLMFGSMLGLSVAARLTPAAVRRTAFDRVVGPRVRGRPVAEWMGEELSRNDPSTVLQAGWSIGRFSSRDWIGAVDVPAAVVLTTLDTIVSPARQMRLAESIPGCELFTVGGDHDVCVTGADRFVPALLAACRSVVRRSRGPSGPLSAQRSPSTGIR